MSSMLRFDASGTYAQVDLSLPAVSSRVFSSLPGQLRHASQP